MKGIKRDEVVVYMIRVFNVLRSNGLWFQFYSRSWNLFIVRAISYVIINGDLVEGTSRRQGFKRLEEGQQLPDSVVP